MQNINLLLDLTEWKSGWNLLLSLSNLFENELICYFFQALTRLATGILNKLTPQKFDKLVEQMKSLPIDTVEKLKCVIDLIFEKVS